MDEKYFSDKIKENDVLSQTHKKTVSMSTLIISILTTIVFVLIVVNQWGNILKLFGVEGTTKNQVQLINLDVGDIVSLTGTLSDIGDIINYTHTIDSVDFGKMGVRSSSLNLNNYIGDVYLEGIVERIYQGTPIVVVDTIYMSEIDEENLDNIQTGEYSDFEYLPNIGLYLDSDFFAKYTLINKGENGTLKIKNLETNYIINLEYFRCSTSDNNKNCDNFNKMFSESNSEKFIDEYGTNYYKQMEVSSWFFSNGSLFGYFIHNTEDSLIKTLVKDITLINQKFVEKNILNNVSLLCTKGSATLKKITTQKLSFKNNDLYLNLEGNDSKDSTISCELRIDPSLRYLAELVSLETLENNQNDDKIDDSVSQKTPTVNYDRDSQVEQFPVNFEKVLKFTSRRGHTFVFPSSNLAYAAQSAEEDFGQLGVNCFSAMHVVSYPEKDLLSQKANVKVYECSIKNSFDDGDKSLIYQNIQDKHFVIEIIDPAWISFAHNIEIKLD